MIEDQPGRGESEEAGAIRERSLKEQDQPGQKVSDEAEVTKKENELKDEPPERGSDRKSSRERKRYDRGPARKGRI